jgi:type IV pilus assembly protein PilP
MHLRLSTLLFTASLLSACGGDMPDLQHYVEEVHGRPPQPIEPVPEFPKLKPHVYNSDGRPDPFQGRSDLDPKRASTNYPALDPGRKPEELEQYPLDAIDMVGTLEQQAVTWGLVKIPGGALLPVQVGNYAGQNNGRITRITDTRIELTEVVSDGPEAWRERKASIALSN